MRGCGYKARLPQHQPPNTLRMKAIYVFRRMDGRDHFFIGDMLGQGQLDQDAVYIQIVVQLLDDPEQAVLAYAIFQSYQGAPISDLGTGLYFGSYIGLAGAIIPYQYRRQMRDLLPFRL